MLGLRFTFNQPQQRTWPTDGTIDWLCRQPSAPDTRGPGWRISSRSSGWSQNAIRGYG